MDDPDFEAQIAKSLTAAAEPASDDPTTAVMARARRGDRARRLAMGAALLLGAAIAGAVALVVGLGGVPMRLWAFGLAALLVACVALAAVASASTFE